VIKYARTVDALLRPGIRDVRERPTKVSKPVFNWNTVATLQILNPIQAHCAKHIYTTPYLAYERALSLSLSLSLSL